MTLGLSTELSRPICECDKQLIKQLRTLEPKNAQYPASKCVKGSFRNQLTSSYEMNHISIRSCRLILFHELPRFGMVILNSGKVFQVIQNAANGIVTFLLSTIPIDFAVVKMGSRKLELAKN